MGLTLKRLREALKSNAISTNPPVPRCERTFADLHTINLEDPLEAPQSSPAVTDTGSTGRSKTNSEGEKTPVQQGSSKINGFFKTITGQTLPPNSKKQGDLKPLGAPSRVKGVSETRSLGSKKKITEDQYKDLNTWKKAATALRAQLRYEGGNKENGPEKWLAVKGGKTIGTFNIDGKRYEGTLDEAVINEGHDPIMVALEKIATGKYPDGKAINGNHVVTFPNGKTVTVNRGTASSMVALRDSISPERAAKMAVHIETGPMAFLKVADFAVSSHS